MNYLQHSKQLPTITTDGYCINVPSGTFGKQGIIFHEKPL